MAGRTTARGYGAQHQRTRAMWAPQVATGTVPCAKCGEPITPTQPWDLGHTPGDKRTYAGPMHVECNRNTRDERGRDPKPKTVTRW